MPSLGCVMGRMQGAARGPLERLVAKREAHGSCGGLHSAAQHAYRRNTDCIIAVELLDKRHSLQARPQVDEHEFNILPQELVELAMQDGWPKKVADALSNAVADCTPCACRSPSRASFLTRPPPPGKGRPQRVQPPTAGRTPCLLRLGLNAEPSSY
jgi:hypothetical protein